MKKFTLGTVLVALMIFLSGCGIRQLEFEGKTRPIEHIEEILENRLEAENPQYDLDVRIGLDSD